MSKELAVQSEVRERRAMEEVSRFLLSVLADAADVAHFLVCFFIAAICRGIHNVLGRETLYVL